MKYFRCISKLLFFFWKKQSCTSFTLVSTFPTWKINYGACVMNKLEEMRHMHHEAHTTSCIFNPKCKCPTKPLWLSISKNFVDKKGWDLIFESQACIHTTSLSLTTSRCMWLSFGWIWIGWLTAFWVSDAWCKQRKALLITAHTGIMVQRSASHSVSVAFILWDNITKHCIVKQSCFLFRKRRLLRFKKLVVR